MLLDFEVRICAQGKIEVANCGKENGREDVYIQLFSRGNRCNIRATEEGKIVRKKLAPQLVVPSI
jgi:hypothetical protein